MGDLADGEVSGVHVNAPENSTGAKDGPPASTTTHPLQTQDPWKPPESFVDIKAYMGKQIQELQQQLRQRAGATTTATNDEDKRPYMHHKDVEKPSKYDGKSRLQ